jgi:UDPglucose 6-dehydrogenase
LQVELVRRWRAGQHDEKVQRGIHISINGIAAFCEVTGANVREEAKAIGSDSRIGPKFLQAGPGFGGSCLLKDILNLVYLFRHFGLEEVAAYWEQVVELNYWQQRRNHFAETCGYGVLGFAFKADTNDSRESPAIRFCRDLLEEGAILQILDPKVEGGQISADLRQPASAGSWQRVADALLLLTEWQQFEQIDWGALAAAMRSTAWLFDARAKADAAVVRAAGLNVLIVGEV